MTNEQFRANVVAIGVILVPAAFVIGGMLHLGSPSLQCQLQPLPGQKASAPGTPGPTPPASRIHCKRN